MNKVHLIDCVEFMRKLPDNHYDLAIVDPPYGIGEDGSKFSSRSKNRFDKRSNSRIIIKHQGYIKKKWDLEKPKKEYFKELFRLSKNQIIFGANHFIESFCKNSSCWIVWDKVNGNSHFADCELAWTSFNTAVRQIAFMWSGMIQASSVKNGRKMEGNVKKRETRIHPTQKPVALYKWLLTNYAKPGQTIFDSHVGSGSIRIACHDLGFDFEGCEIDKDYWEAQEKRFKNNTIQLELFEKKELQKLTFSEEA